MCSLKDLFLKIFQSVQKNICVRRLYQKETPAKVLSCEFHENVKGTYFFKKSPAVIRSHGRSQNCIYAHSKNHR